MRPPNGDTRKSEVHPLEEHVIVYSSFSTIINPPLEQEEAIFAFLGPGGLLETSHRDRQFYG